MQRGLRVRGVLLDLSGTLHVEDTPTPRAVEAMARLKSSGIPFRFITNTTKEPKCELLARLGRIGFTVGEEEVFTSLTAARRVVEREKLRPLLLLEDSAKRDFEGVCTDEPNSVVVGLAPTHFNYATMNQAFGLLMTGARLIAIHKSKYFKTLDGLSLGPGPFVTALEYASGKTATVVGKPERAFYECVLREMGLGLDMDADGNNCNVTSSSVGECVMIGDDVSLDVHGSQSLGMKGILVKTGKYREGDESTISPPPAVVCNNLAEAVDLILGLSAS